MTEPAPPVAVDPAPAPSAAPTLAPRVTVELLVHRGACAREVDLFRRRYPDGAEVTVERCVAEAKRWSFDWAGRNLLTLDGRIKFVQLTDGELGYACDCRTDEALAQDGYLCAIFVGEAEAFATAALRYGLCGVPA